MPYYSKISFFCVKYYIFEAERPFFSKQWLTKSVFPASTLLASSKHFTPPCFPNRRALTLQFSVFSTASFFLLEEFCLDRGLDPTTCGQSKLSVQF